MNISKFQLSFFGAYTHIKPTSDILIKLTESYKKFDFIPSTNELLEFDSNTGKFNRTKRIRMITQNSTWEIPFNPNRIDIVCLNPEEKKLEEIVAFSLEIAKILLDILGIKVGRMAFNAYFKIDYLPEDETSIIFKDFLKVLPTFNGVELRSWGTKYNSYTSFDYNNEKEIINNIFNIDYLKKNDENKVINIVLDINTDALKMVERFDYEGIEVFSKYSIDKANEICNDISLVIKNEEEK